MDPLVFDILIGLFLSPFYYILLRPLETFKNGLRYPITFLCFLYTLSLLSRDNNTVLWFISVLQSIIIWILVDNFAGYPYSRQQPQEQQYNQKHEIINTSATISPTRESLMWIKTHMMILYSKPRQQHSLIIILILCLHFLDTMFIWNPKLPYTVNDCDLIATVYNIAHLIMFITLVWIKNTIRRHQNNDSFREVVSSQAFFIYHFIVGLQPTRSLMRIIITCPFFPNNEMYWKDNLLFSLLSLCAYIDTLPALILCFNGVSSANELVSFRKEQEYNDMILMEEDEEEKVDDKHNSEKKYNNNIHHITSMNVPVYDPNMLNVLKAEEL
ncbi:hypothetical protein BDC45DRAFT_514013 [Circinella umbellata]|nr:hypothetical protein BDC45DRAFT_514013 [Circinella umbellata]